MYLSHSKALVYTPFTGSKSTLFVHYYKDLTSDTKCEAWTCYSAQLLVLRQMVATCSSKTGMILILLCSICTLLPQLTLPSTSLTQSALYSLGDSETARFFPQYRSKCEARTCYSAQILVPRWMVTASSSQTGILILLCSICTLQSTPIDSICPLPSAQSALYSLGSICFICTLCTALQLAGAS